MTRYLLLTGIFISCVLSASGQSQQDEIDRLQKLAKANEQVAIQNAMAARRAEADARNMRCLAIAYEMAEYTIDVQDKELSALLAVQAYNFNEQHGGYSYNQKIYNGLFNALQKNDRIPKSLVGDAEKKYLLENANSKPTLSAQVPNSQQSVVAEQNGNLNFVTGGMIVRILSGHRAQVDQIQFSHAGNLMATSGKDNTIRIWNLAQLNQRPIVIAENDQISKLTFSSDDTTIFYALGVKKATIKQRPLNMKLMVADLCNVLTRNFTAEEWNTFVAADLPYEATCTNRPPNNK